MNRLITFIWSLIMGGEREDKIPAKKTTPRGTETVGEIRFHESGGEVHFHDDKAGRKVAVPIGTWFDAWGKLACGERNNWTFIDCKNATELGVAVTSTNGRIDVALSVGPAQFSAEFQKLQQFTEGA